MNIQDIKKLTEASGFKGIFGVLKTDIGIETFGFGNLEDKELCQIIVRLDMLSNSMRNNILKSAYIRLSEFRKADG